ncbi:MAG: SdpI family protein [Ruminococcaceae bacterium]|nr:SdpI family protein [Oscillospiraceae bacterium]
MEALAELYYVIMMPLIMLITGAVMWRIPPKFKGMGYHTARSESSPEAWAYAQHLCSRIVVFTNLPLLLLSVASAVIATMVDIGEDVCIALVWILIVLELVAVFGMIAAVEGRLKKLFGKK